MTPKANKKKIPCPEPEGDSLPQKETLDTMLIKDLAKKVMTPLAQNGLHQVHRILGGVEVPTFPHLNLH